MRLILAPAKIFFQIRRASEDHFLAALGFQEQALLRQVE
jgi:hypothetical protein